MDIGYLCQRSRTISEANQEYKALNLGNLNQIRQQISNIYDMGLFGGSSKLL